VRPPMATCSKKPIHEWPDTTAKSSNVIPQTFGPFPFGDYRRFPSAEEPSHLDSGNHGEKCRAFYTSGKRCGALPRIVWQRLPQN
jgi:hypothetical protein